VTSGLSDEDIVGRVRQGETALFEVLMRRYNQRIYRVVRSIVGEHEAEDVMQQAYLNAFRHMDQFAGRAKVSTWLTRIAVHEALSRVRKTRPVSLDEPRADDEGSMTAIDTLRSDAPDPEQALLHSEASGLLESAVSALPDAFRTVFMLREIEGLSTTETADSLGLREDTVKTRLHRARRHMRTYLSQRLGAAATAAYSFHATRCDRVIARVFAALAADEQKPHGPSLRPATFV